MKPIYLNGLLGYYTLSLKISFYALSVNHYWIITRAVSKLIDIALTDLQLEKIQIAAGEHNLPSHKVCEYLGMTLEGIITNHENLNGRIINHAIYGLSK
nr:GNAT family protein [Aliivibrio fischeri]